MKFLNAHERVTCILECDVQQRTAQMMEAMKRRYVKGQQQAIYLDINATKCSSTAFREILGGAFPNHMLRTANITKD